MVTNRCSITPGLVEYPVSISNGSLSIRNKTTGFFPSVSDSSFLGPNKTRTGRGKPIYDAASIGGILTAAKYILDAQITISTMVETMLKNRTRDVTIQPTFTGRMAAKYMQLSSWSTQSCAVNMPDPTGDILSVMNGLLFRTGLAAGHVSPFPMQTIDAQQSVHTLVYRVKWEFFALAVALMVLCIILVAGSLSSWWRLGRAVSMSPVEIAKAFDSSLMQNETISYAPLDTLIEHVGDIPVKYGVIRETEVIDHIPVVKRRVLRFGGPDNIHDPMRDSLSSISG